MHSLLLFTCLNLAQAHPVAMADSSEYLDMHKVRVNQTIPFFSSPEKLILVLGKPDEITRDSSECGTWFEHYTFKTYHWKNTSFQNVGDTTIIDNLDLSTKKFSLSIPGITLDAATSIEHVRKHFPIACSNAYEWLDPDTQKKLLIVRIPSTPLADDCWVLRFLNGSLVHIHYHIPC